MFKFQDSSGKTYRVTFAHCERGTACYIYRLDGPGSEITVATGWAGRYVYEPHVKKIGRKYALSYALQDSGFDKVDRTLAWEEYKKVSHV